MNDGEEQAIADSPGHGEPERRKRKKETPEERKQRLQSERDRLIAAVDTADYSQLRNRVAAILNLYSHTRNSDIALVLQYWEVFQPEVYDAINFKPQDMYQLERYTTIVRSRAKIQNDYGLFLADEPVRRRRRQIEENVKEDVIDDAAPRRVLSIFADETGKNADHVIVAAVFVLTGRSLFSITKAIDRWQESSPWNRKELHFKELKESDLPAFSEYLDVIRENREYLSFHTISKPRAHTSRHINEVIRKLHEYMIIRGLQHEISTNRISLPYEVQATIDHEQSLDEFALADMNRIVNSEFCRLYGADLTLSSLKAQQSHTSPIVQLADVIAGAVNRRRNHKGAHNVKDTMSELVISKLDINLEDDDPDLDSSASLAIVGS